MYYAEFLRVLKALRVLGYILAGLLLVVGVTRLFSHDEGFQVGGPAPAPGAAPVITQNADGTTTKTYVDRKGRHVTIRSGNGSYTISTIQAPAVAGAAPRVTTVSGNENVPVDVLLAISACVAGILASMLGLALSRENDGHLELAWTKPASRDGYALATMATDAAGILVSVALTFASILLAFAIIGGLPYIHADAATLPAVIFAAVFPLSMYAMIVAATASLSRGAVVLAVFWPVAVILPTLSRISWLNIGAAVRLLDIVNPIAYFYAFHSEGASKHLFVIPMSDAALTGALTLIAALCVGASLAQWRRLEA